MFYSVVWTLVYLTWGFGEARVIAAGSGFYAVAVSLVGEYLKRRAERGGA
jgi:hypothetical protein